MRCRSGDSTQEKTRSRFGHFLSRIYEQCGSTRARNRYFQLDCLFLSGEESSPGRSLYTVHVALQSNLSWCY